VPFLKINNSCDEMCDLLLEKKRKKERKKGRKVNYKKLPQNGARKLYNSEDFFLKFYQENITSAAEQTILLIKSFLK